ncbi:MAG: endonuclease/exonuclease/phosphatase family protein [Candidatus Binatia bacterium]
MPTKSLISVVSYNIHQCVGLDGRRDPTRIARIIQALKPDIAGLQEVSSESNGRVESLQMKYLADATGLLATPGPTITKHNSEYGNVLLSRYPVTDFRCLDISVPGREPRGAIDATVQINGRLVRVVVSHLGLSAAERRYQVIRLLVALAENDSSPVFLIMDHNEWFPLRQSISLIHEHLGKPPTLATFPAVLPFLAHDRVWVKPLKSLVKVQRYLTPLTRIASDHLPLKVTIDTHKLF